MSDPFVWFDLRTKDADASRSFYEQLLGWEVSDPIAGDGVVRAQGSEQPWASVVPDGGDNIGWFPYVEVPDLETATERAEGLGATVLQPAVGAYLAESEDGGHQFYGLMVLTIEGDEIAAITGFQDPALGDYFRLPSWLPPINA